ncbi:MAG: phosphatase PAP2 family protein [Planctomycetaceae bacterium]|nr:phosphatase PAP2 family protein [Planctomycetaceae bacterium]
MQLVKIVLLSLSLWIMSVRQTSAMNSTADEIPKLNPVFYSDSHSDSANKSDYAKNTLFDQLSARNIEFDSLQPRSDLSSFELTSLRTADSNLTTRSFCNPEYYRRYINYDRNHTTTETSTASMSAADNSTLNSRSRFFRHHGRTRDFFNRTLPTISSDFRHFNTCDSLCNMFVALGGAAVLANTSLDRDFRNWFCRNISRPNSSNKSVDDFNSFTKEFGEIPVIAIFTLSAAGYKLFPRIFPNCESKESTFGEYATQVFRGYLVGTPANLLGQLFVGAGRPSNGSSAWFKGRYNGVSGHAFVGAVPFITAAQMTDNLWLKFILYICSTFTAVSRIYEDSHYLSQSLFGWYIAYLSARAISKTEGKKLSRGLTIFPIIEKEKAGIGFVFKF